MKNDVEVMCGLYKCIEKLSGSIEMEEKISSELVVYKSMEGMFGLNIEKKLTTALSPDNWLNAFPFFINFISCK